MAARRMHVDRGGTSLRWLAERGVSLRAYEIRHAAGPSPCVSTRSSELTFVLEGELELTVGAGRGPSARSLVARAGEGLVVLRGTPHLTRSRPGTRFVIVDLPDAPTDAQGLAALPASSIPLAVERKLSSLWEQRGPVDVGGALAPVLAEAVTRRLVPAGSAQSAARMLAVKRHLEARYGAALDLGEIARRFGVSRFYLAREFRRSFGTTPLEYVQGLRLEHFVWSLLGGVTPGSLLSLAAEAGFGDYATFCRRVRKRFGVPPSALVAESA